MNNPTNKMASEARASHEKVVQAQRDQVAQRERAGQEFRQGVKDVAQSGIQQHQFGEQMDQRQAEQEQQQQQFEAGQEMDRERMAQQQAQFDKAQQVEIQKARAQRETQEASLQQREAEFRYQKEQDEKRNQIEIQKLRRQTDEAMRKEAFEREQHMTKRRDYYREEVGKLRQAKEKILFGNNDDEITRVLQSTVAQKLGGNNAVDNAISNLTGGSGSQDDLREVVQAIDNYTVKTMVDQAEELGEWSPPAHLIDHPDVQRFNLFMGEAKKAFNTNLQRQLLASMQEGNRGKMDWLRRLHSDPEERDRRLARTASRSMRQWYQTRNMRDALSGASVGGTQMSLPPQTQQGR